MTHEPLPAFASVEELETRLNVELDADAIAQAQMMLEHASNLIRGFTGNSWLDDDGNLSATAVELATLNSVTLEMVKRAVTNPRGATQETAGPFNVSFGQAAVDNLWLTALEKKALHRLSKVGMWTQPVTRGPVETPTPPVRRRGVALDAQAILGD